MHYLCSLLGLLENIKLVEMNRMLEDGFLDHLENSLANLAFLKILFLLSSPTFFMVVGIGEDAHCDELQRCYHYIRLSPNWFILCSNHSEDQDYVCSRLLLNV